MNVTSNWSPTYFATCTSDRCRKYDPGALGALIELPALSKNPMSVASTHAVMLTTPGSTFTTIGWTTIEPLRYWPSSAVPATLRRKLDFTGSAATCAAAVDQSLLGSA